MLSSVIFFFLMIRRPPRSTLFPTRRSSDLIDVTTGRRSPIPFTAQVEQQLAELVRTEHRLEDSVLTVRQIRDPRSEEHTSELQSRLHLVCRLLLEKKKKKEIHYAPRINIIQ